MKAQVLFENNDIRCRLIIAHESDDVEPGTAVRPVKYIEHHDFDSVSALVNYCLENNIEVAIGDCTTVESLD